MSLVRIERIAIDIETLDALIDVSRAEIEHWEEEREAIDDMLRLERDTLRELRAERAELRNESESMLAAWNASVR